MAKSNRSALGRGLGALMSSEPENIGPDGRTTNRQRVEYDENEFDNMGIPTASSESNLSNADTPAENVSRETFSVEEKMRGEVANSVLSTPSNIGELPVDVIVPNPNQPRTNFKQDELEELSRSIKKDGLLQPILVRTMGDGTYQIIAGERRWQACKLAGIDTVPVRIKEVDDDKALELALIENVQRSALNPIEEAYGYRRLMDRKKMTQADIAQAMSKGRSTVANSLRLLDLPEAAQQMLFEDKITAGHARAILSVPTKEGRETITNKLIDNKLRVRETESMARLLANKPERPAQREPIPSTYKTVAKALRNALNTNVKVKSSNGRNKIEIEFIDEDDLKRLFDELIAYVS